MRTRPQYVSYDEPSKPIPHVESEMRERGRYSGVGAVIDDLSGGFDDPDDTDDAVIEDILSKAQTTVAEKGSLRNIPSVRADAPRAAMTQPIDSAPDAAPSGSSCKETLRKVAPGDELAVASEALSQAIEGRRAVEEALRLASEECDRAEAALRLLVETQRACDAARDAALRWSSAPSKSVQSSAPMQGGQFSQFKAVYESRDGKLCLFEDASGHLVAVDTERLA